MKRVLSIEEKEEFRDIFQQAYDLQHGSYRASAVAKNTVVVNTINLYDDSKKVNFAIYMLDINFRALDQYPMYYSLLDVIFKKKLKMTEDDIMNLCDRYETWFDMFDAVETKKFVRQILKNVSANGSDELKKRLTDFRDNMQNAQINFAPQRASNREATIELLTEYLN